MSIQNAINNTSASFNLGGFPPEIWCEILKDCTFPELVSFRASGKDPNNLVTQILVYHDTLVLWDALVKQAKEELGVDLEGPGITSLITIRAMISKATEFPEWFNTNKSLLAQLAKLDLRYRKLFSLPIKLGELTQLKEIDLSYNPFPSLPEVIGNLDQTLIIFDKNPIYTLRSRTTAFIKNNTMLGSVIRITAMTAAGTYYTYPGRAIWGLMLTDSLATKFFNCMNPMMRQPDGSHQHQFSKTRAVIIGGAALSLLYTGYQMYEAVANGTTDGGLFETAGMYVGSALQFTAMTADYLWNNFYLETPFGLRLPLINYNLWEGRVPLQMVIGVGSLFAKAIKNKLPKPVAAVVGDLADTTSTYSNTIIAAKVATKMTTSVINAVAGVLRYANKYFW